MKNAIYLPTLVLILFTNASFAQRMLSEGVKPYAETWPATLMKSMDRAGFESNAIRGRSSRNDLQLDSTKTFYGYTPGMSGDSTPLNRTIHEYPFNNEEIETYYEYLNQSWLPLNRTTQTSDDQGRMVDAFAEAYDPETETFRPDSRLELFPHGNSPELIDSFFTYLWDEDIMDMRIIFSVRNVFDSQDRQLESYSSIDYFGDPVIFREIYSYDDNGDNHLIEEFAILGPDTFPSSRTEQIFVNHRLIQSIVYVSDDLGFIPKSMEKYSYNVSGTLRRHISFDWDPELENFRMARNIEYLYDDEDRLTGKETAIIYAGAVEEREFTAYAYLEGDNLFIERTFFWDDDLIDWILDTKKFYYYNGLVSGAPTPRPAEALQAFPNPTTGIVNFRMNDRAEVQVFDASGRLVKSIQVQPYSPLDMTTLPNGIYTVTAREGNDFYVGRIVKQE
jgi:hypothetical protein